MAKQDDYVPLNLRVPVKLKIALQNKATKKLRSLNETCILGLAFHLHTEEARDKFNISDFLD
jgi:hypothetical protein